MLSILENIVVFLIFINLVPQYTAIYDPNNVVTKPPIKKESLSWPNRNTKHETESTTKHETVIELTKENFEHFGTHDPHGSSSKNHWSKISSSKTSDRFTESVNERSAVPNQNPHSTWVFPDESHTDQHYATNINGRSATVNNNFHSKWVFPSENPPEEKNWDKNGWMPSQPCPEKATGQFPYPGDCKKFYNCWKGRGILQVCAPGTLFNPETLECDFPAKVRCLDSTTYYSPVPIVDNNGPDLSGGSRSSKAITVDSKHKPRQNYQQYQEYGSDHPAGHVRVHNSNQYNPSHSHNHHRQENHHVVKRSHSKQREPFAYQYSHFQYNYGQYMQHNGNPQPQVQHNQNNNFNPASGFPQYNSHSTSYHQPQPDNTASQNNPSIGSNNQVRCPPGFSGLLPHPTICKKFLNCDHGRTFIQDCGPGTVFNPAFSGCDYPSSVNCEERTSSGKIDFNNRGHNN